MSQKRTSTNISETDSSAPDDDPNKIDERNKTRRVSTNAPVSAATSLQLGTAVATEDIAVANTASAAANRVESMKSIGARIQDLFHSDNAKINVTLADLNMDCMNDENKRDDFAMAGGCLALVLLLKKCLDKGIDSIPACAKVTELNELPELVTLHKSLGVITNLMSKHDGSRLGITAIGGAEAVVKVAMTFPKCQALQEAACGALLIFTHRNNISGKQKIIESGGIEVLLAAVNNHLNSDNLCKYACTALCNIFERENKENIRLLSNLGGATAIAKVRKEWQDDDTIQVWVRCLAKLIGTDMNSWTGIMLVATPVATKKVTAANTALTATKHEETVESIGDMIVDLAHSDNAEVDANLDTLNLDLLGDKSKGYKIQVAGGCHALVLLLEKCLAEAIAKSPACDQVTELHELAELTTLHKTLHIMIRLSCHHFESKVGIAVVGGVEAVIKAMKTFPNCYKLQEFAIIFLLNLAICSIGKKRIIEADGMEYLLTAINNHLNSDNLCRCACIALSNIIEKENKEVIRLLISLDGATAVANVSKEWPDGDAAQAWMRLAKLIGKEITSWADKEYDDPTPSEERNKVRRVSTNASTSSTVSLQVDTPVANVKVTALNTASVAVATATKQEDELMESIGQMIRDLAHSDNVEVTAVLDSLNLDLLEDKKKCYKIQVAGGCHALVLLLLKCLAKATDEHLECNQVTELNELPELITLHKTLHILNRLTHNLDESKVGIAVVGGVEAVIKVMKTFPKCKELQEYACFLAHNLASCFVGKKRIMEADGMEIFLAAINNHLDHADTCERAFSVLMIVMADSNDNTDLFMDLGGATAAAKVKRKWPKNDRIQTGMCHLSKPIAAYFNRSAKQICAKK
jgi:hypothetical protein